MAVSVRGIVAFNFSPRNLTQVTSAMVGVLLGDGAGRDVFSFTGGERDAPLAATPPADRGTV